jgi:tetratricopeptide (TPR) repeat protein
MSTTSFIKQKLWPFLAGISSALVMLLAFFIPSIQDQYDRYQARKIIEQYEQLGNDFFNEEKYDMAEQAYQKAFEYSENKRLDIEVKRLNARISRVNMDPKWGAALPEDLEEIDFQYALHLQKGKEKVQTLNSYAIFLASKGKLKEASSILAEAISLDSTNAISFINTGNVNDQLGRKKQAIENYTKAITIDKENIEAYYNLGLLYKEQGMLQEAKTMMGKALQFDSLDNEVKKQYQLLVEEIRNEQTENK